MNSGGQINNGSHLTNFQLPITHQIILLSQGFVDDLNVDDSWRTFRNIPESTTKKLEVVIPKTMDTENLGMEIAEMLGNELPDLEIELEQLLPTREQQNDTCVTVGVNPAIASHLKKKQNKCFSHKGLVIKYNISTPTAPVTRRPKTFGEIRKSPRRHTASTLTLDEQDRDHQ